MGTINEDLTAIQTIETGLTSNKVANFAYTDYAYEHDDVNGVPSYNPNNEQNIPVGTTEAMKVNSTVLTQGWRAQASAITRMLMNHFLGRISYNLNKVNDNMASLLSTLLSHIGSANGVASLGSNGRVPFEQLPEGAMSFEGYWNASTNTPELSDSAEGNVKGQYYNVSVSGTQDLGSGSITYLAGDSLVFDGTIWKKISGGAVRSVNNVAPDITGNVDINGSNIRVSGTDSTLLSKFHLKDVFAHIAGRAWKRATVSGLTNINVTYERFNCFANGMWVLSATNGIYYSFDGISWELSNITTGSRNPVMYKNGVWVCGIGYYSTDGRNWLSTGESTSSGTISSMCFGNGKWVAVSSTGDKIFYSTDGITWNSVSIPSATTTYTDPTVSNIIYANNMFIATRSTSSSAYEGYYYSVDAISWAYTNPVSKNLVITYNESVQRWIGVDGINTGLSSYYSTDGLTWTAMNTQSISSQADYFSSNLYTYGSITLVEVLGSSGNTPSLAYTCDGTYWYFCNIENSSLIGTYGNIVNISNLNGTLFMLAYDNTRSSVMIFRSIDGINWSLTTRAIDTTSMKVLVPFGNETVLFYYGTNKVLYSNFDVLIESGLLTLSD